MARVTPAEIQTQMRARVRAHMTASVIGIVAGFAAAGALGAAASQVPEGAARIVLAIVAGMALLSPAPYGIYSAFKRVRCPACDASAVWQMQWQYSIFRPLGSRVCSGCGAELYAPTRSSFARTLAIAIAIAAVVMMAIGFASFFAVRNSSHRSPPRAVVAP